jgi:hypothetical protein
MVTDTTNTFHIQQVHKGLAIRPMGLFVLCQEHSTDIIVSAGCTVNPLRKIK